MSTIDTAALRAQLALAGAEHFSVVSTRTWCDGICDPHSGTCEGHETGRMTAVELAEEVESSDDELFLYGANGQAEARAALIGNLHANTTALCDEVDRLRAEVARFQRVCDEALPREVIPCPNCGRNHVENARHDNPLIDGRKRPHHTHRCYHCGHIWDSGRWSFGVEPAAMAVPAVYDPKHYPEGAKAADAALLWQALREKGAQVCENQAGMLDAVGDHNGARAVRLCASVLRSLNPIVAA